MDQFSVMAAGSLTISSEVDGAVQVLRMVRAVIDGLGRSPRPTFVERVRKGPLHRAVDELAALGRRRMEEPAEGAPSKPDDLTFIAIRRRPSRRC